MSPSQSGWSTDPMPPPVAGSQSELQGDQSQSRKQDAGQRVRPIRVNMGHMLTCSCNSRTKPTQHPKGSAYPNPHTPTIHPVKEKSSGHRALSIRLNSRTWVPALRGYHMIQEPSRSLQKVNLLQHIPLPRNHNHKHNTPQFIRHWIEHSILAISLA